MSIFYKRLESPIGPLFLVASDAALLGLYYSMPPGFLPAGENAILKLASEEISRYFNKELTEFTVPISLAGTDFQRQVWTELQRIPYGTTISYGQLAARIANSKAQRAVGAANGQNPIAIIVPCHRVIASSGKLHGYAGGLDTKRHLLDLEQGLFLPNRVQ